MTADRPTPRLSQHARERCAQMGIATKRVKRIVQGADVVYQTQCYRGSAPRWVANCDQDPALSVLYTEAADGSLLVVTVLWRDEANYNRTG